ncbi:hypothetical protein B0H63DRAFT_104188 [Podospora didyma]|uniref:Uncharacterized protein n=1 Tax=Podospora didyma TaxID=330526 RepID=A0AAE0U3S5_9PEZI|nr:hypothetical protein B0H63DRAFT_104188 [Podospora didyma]
MFDPRADNLDRTMPTLTTTELKPPFATEHSLVAPSQTILPAAVRRGHALASPENDPPAFLSDELLTPKLDRLHAYLWVAGLPVPARPLQRQRMMKRAIFLTERADEHLVWHQDRLFLKPLPNFLLCHDFWEQNLCQDPALHKSACGMLLSYAWLVEHESDFRLAKELGLLPGDVQWHAWVGFMKGFLASLNKSTGTDMDMMDHVDRRYQYGELRLSRLNMLTRYFLPSLWSRRNFVFGFTSTSTWYTAFFERNFGWLLGVFIYLNVILTALQVGLATRVLQESEQFQNISYAVILISILGLALGVVLILLVWVTLFCYHLLSTLALTKEVRRREILSREKDV